MEVVAAHTPLDPLRERPQELVDFQRAIGNRRLVVPVLPFEEMGDRSPSAWQSVGRELDELGRQLRLEGFELGFHNHLIELHETEGRLGLEWLLDTTGPENVFLELDLAWVRRAGHDPAELVSRFGERCRLVHIKEPSGGGRPEPDKSEPSSFEELRMRLRAWHPFEMYVGEGSEDWATVARATNRARVLCHIVEYEGLGDPEMAARRGREVLESVLSPSES
jgi:sugar phosphate isomerase/epimerase